MKNLTFEFEKYDKIINLNSNIILFFTKKISCIDVIVNIMNDNELCLKFSISNSCLLESIQAVYINKNNKIILVWQDLEQKITMSIYKLFPSQDASIYSG